MNTEELKALAYDLIDKLVASPFEYSDENREDLLTLGAIFGVISAVDAICKKEEQDESGYPYLLGEKEEQDES